MKRYSLIQARGGDYTSYMEGAVVEGEGVDVVEMGIKGGTISVFVPASLPDDELCEECWFDNHTVLDIELEDGTHISGWVREGESHFEAESLASAGATRMGH